MTEEVKTKEQLLAELSELQRRTLELDSLESDRKQAEDALRESEAKFQALVEQIPDAVIYMASLDERSSTLYISPQIENLLGYSQEEYKADSDIWAKRIHPDDYDRVMEALSRCHQTGTQFNSEYRMIRKDSRVIWFHDVADIVRDHHGNPLYIIGVNTDMTERKQAEDLVRIQCDLAFALGSTSDLEMTLDHVLDASFQVEGIDCGGVYMVDESTGALDLLAHKGLPRLFVESVYHYDVDTTEAQMVMQGTPIYGLFSDISPNPYVSCRNEGLQALAVIPVKYEGDVVAVLNLSSHTQAEIPPGARKALEAIAAQIGGVISRVRTEEALRKSQKDLQSLFNTVDDFLFILDLNGQILRINPMVEKRLGFSAEELSGKSFAELHPPDRREDAANVTSKMLAGQESLCLIPLQSKDGKQIPVETRLTRDEWEGQGVIFGVSRDIAERKRAEKELDSYRHHLEDLVKERTTELAEANEKLTLAIENRKRIEEALRESEEKYRAIVEAFDGMIYVCSKDYRVEFMNKRFVDRTGYDPTGDFCYKALHGLDAVCPWCVNEQVQKGETVRWEMKSPKDNRWYHIVNVPIYHPDGSISKQAMIHDITERKAAEQAVEESYNIINRSPAVVFLWKNEKGWPVEFVSENVKEIFGYTAETFVTGKVHYANTVHPEDLDRVAEEVALYSEEKGRKEFTHEPYRIVTKDGKVKWLDDRTYIRRNEKGEITHYQGIVLDITERHHLEAQLLQAQKMEAVGTLAGGIAHDFNNLLQSIQGYADLLLFDKKEGNPGYRELHEVVKASRRGSELTRQLLTFSRKIESRLRPVDLNIEVDKIRKLLSRTIPKMIDIEARLGKDLRAVNGDPAQLEQVLVNLALNAKDAMSEGGNLIIQTENVMIDDTNCREHPDNKPGEYVVLSVSDTGCGMDKATSDRIFDPFFTTKGLAKGTGLGLAMVYGIVKNHGGHISCASEVGIGATFKIYLPAIDRQVVAKETRNLEMFEGGTETILLVDDEDFIRDLGRETLSRFGYTVLTAVDGETALKLYREQKGQIDLVILDLIMPGMSGTSVLEALLKIDPEVKVIVASGYSDIGPMRESHEAGAKSFIAKPYEVKQLLQMIREVMDRE